MPRSPALLILALLLTTPVLTGCLGGEDDPSNEPVLKQRADVNSNLGGIEGVVTDEAIQPVEGANVSLAETGEDVQAASDGSFAFSLLEPGTYTVNVRGPQIVSSQQTIQVNPNRVSTVDFIVSRSVSDQPFTQQVEWSAFIECGVGAGIEGVVSGTIAICELPNTVSEEAGLGGNATNDDFLHNIRFEAPIETLVWEAQWDTQGNPLAENLWLAADVEGHAQTFAGNYTLYVDRGASSPFHVAIARENFTAIADYFETTCNEGDDSYCGYGFQERGWPFTFRTFTAADCVPAPASVCTPLQLKVDHVFSAFYNAPAPDGFSVFGGDA